MHANEPWIEAAIRQGNAALELIGESDLRLVASTMDITADQQGFGGQSFLITLDDGTQRLLCGPWQGATPEGLVAVAWRMPGDPENGRSTMYVTEQLFTDMMGWLRSSGVRLARVSRLGGGTRLQPYKKEWGAPKSVWRHNMKKAAEAAS